MKVLEALYAGKAVVTTSIGAQGLDGNQRQAVIIADEPQQFATCVLTLLGDVGAREHIEKAAKRVAASFPTWDAAASQLALCYERLLETRSTDG